GAEPLGDHRRVRRVALRSDSQLPFGGRGTPDRADLAVRPWLFGHPREFVVAVAERRAEDVVVPLGEKVTTLIHLDESVAPLHRLELIRHIARRAVADVPEIEVVRSSHED